MASGISFKGEKLVGRSNYIEWLTNATLFFEINGFMPYISGLELEPDKSLYYKADNTAYSPKLAVKYIDKLAEFQRNNIKALGAIKSVISVDNSERFKDKKTAKELFEAIKATFGESSLELIGRYLDRIIGANYSSFKTMDEYTSQVQASAIYLKELNYEMPRPFLAWLLFKGLPSFFDSFSSRKYEELAKDIRDIDISKLISDLISEESRINSNIDLEANKANSDKNSFCKHCKKKGYIESSCYKKYLELKPKPSSKKSKKDKKDLEDQKDTKPESSQVIMNILADSSDSLSYFSKSNDFRNKLVLDSGATEHYTPNKDWLLSYKPVYNKYITVANGTKIPIKGTGNIPVYINNTEVNIIGVNYVPDIKTTLISSNKLAKKG